MRKDMYTVIQERAYTAGRLSDGLSKKVLPEIDEFIICLKKNPFDVRKVKQLTENRRVYRKRFGSWRLIYVVDKKEKIVTLLDLCIKAAHTYKP
ncbi:hypothetical protein CDAR_604491 [Caerostris darwini]|uniref:Type II toxin-antitoxin system RelE/ParE family toxin n=1 Tax=Caerostris darwini TaxID=1538125 RepID=A0AAV4NBW2_9ARAC|nr:hypothetical protein CDAR_604491 [Caerostris darwini]